GRLLKRVIEICEELEAENDILQTKLLMMHNELEQQNAKAAQQIYSYLQSRLPQIDEPLTRADIQYLFACFHAQKGETEASLSHLHECLKSARKGRNFKLIGQARILRFIQLGLCPDKDRAELSRILRYLKRGGSELEASDHLLKLYQIHTALLHQSRHRRRLLRMLDLYRKARNPGRYRAVRALLEQTSGATKNPVPAYQT